VKNFENRLTFIRVINEQQVARFMAHCVFTPRMDNYTVFQKTRDHVFDDKLN